MAKNKDDLRNLIEQENPGIGGYIALALFLVVFSGLLRGMGGWSALDFTTLIGKYGEIYEGISFVGKGAVGARDGFMQGFKLIPVVMFAMGLVALAEHYKALSAAQRLLTPLMRPLLGLPGVAAITFMASLNSSDAGAVMTRRLAEQGYLTQDERTTFVSYQFAGSGTIVNVFASGAPLIPIVIWSPGLIFLVIFLIKIVGANLVRFYLARRRNKTANRAREVA